MTAALPAYAELVRHWTRLHRFDHVYAIASWDRSAMMPAGGNEARSLALAELDALLHGLRTEPRLAQLLAAAETEPLESAEARANLAEMRRQWQAGNALPPALVEALSLATSRCEHGWRTQRPANDWPGFLASFRDVVTLVREQAVRLGDAKGLSAYDALLDGYEPGMRCRDVDHLFDDVLGWLPALIERAVARQQREPAPVVPRGPFPAAAQRALGIDVMNRLRFDFDAGRLDESAHPFTGGVPEDIRLTTRYHDRDFVRSLMATIHETGHARYEQGLPRELVDQPVGRARSMGLHESQSLSFEMQLARSRGFIGLLVPLVRKHFGDDPAYTEENLERLLVRVEPGLIRVDADEATYPLHVILRYRIERELVEGEVEADDIPALWNDAMQRLLGLDTRGDFADGCLQDIHWGAGLIGYFPCYTLGAMYAAQWFAAIRRDVPDLDARVASGDLAPALGWLERSIWQQASRWPTDELARRASGEPLNAAHFRRHLETRYGR